MINNSRYSEILVQYYRVEGLESIVVSDRDGVTLVEGGFHTMFKVPNLHTSNGAARSGSIPSATVKPPFLGIFSIASEQVIFCFQCYYINAKCYFYINQASKLGLRKNKGIISYYSGHQVVQFNYFPLVLTFIAHTDANTGEMFASAGNNR